MRIFVKFFGLPTLARYRVKFYAIWADTSHFSAKFGLQTVSVMSSRQCKVNKRDILENNDRKLRNLTRGVCIPLV